jgi:hypothetical protein
MADKKLNGTVRRKGNCTIIHKIIDTFTEM